MFAAAGIVVTEISTPTSAPDFAEVSESTPAQPANIATISEKASGWEMNWVSGWISAEKSSGVRPTARINSAKMNAAVIPIGKPIRRALAERRNTSGRLCTAATHSPAIGPNSGPTTIAPMIRIGESSITPTDAIRHARTMNARKLADISMFSEVRDSTSSQITASVGLPTAAFSARSAALGDLGVDLLHRDRPLACRSPVREGRR